MLNQVRAALGGVRRRETDAVDAVEPVDAAPVDDAVSVGEEAVDGDAPSEAAVVPEAVAVGNEDDSPAVQALLPGGLSLRLTLRARPAALARSLALAAACAVTGFLMLTALGHAARHPAHAPDSLARLGWCAVPLAAVALSAVAVFRSETSASPSPALAAIGIGPARLPLLATAQAVLTCVLGSGVALVAFLLLRDHLTAGRPLPAAGVATLLAVAPLTVAGACLAGLRPGRDQVRPILGPAIGIIMVLWGLAAEIMGPDPVGRGHGTVVQLPGGLGPIGPMVLAGWALTVAGPVVAGPGLVHVTGRLLSVWRPRAVRLLAGRALQADAARIGQPLGLLCAAGCAGLSGWALRDADSRPLGALTVLAAAVVLLCPVLALVSATAGARRARAESAGVLTALGAPRGVLRSAALVRTAVLLGVFVPLTLALAWLAVPHHG